MHKTENGQLVEMTQEEINALQLADAKLAAEVAKLSATQYQRNRAAEYPPMADYFDGIVKGDTAQVQTYIAACLAVKNKYPKPQ
jgi:hypothetical protein